MELINLSIFVVLALTIVFSALLSIFVKRIFYSVLFACVCFLAIAILFLSLNAEFVGISQIFIYGVGVSILLIFAIMFTSKEEEQKLQTANPIRFSLATIAIVALFLSISCFLTSPHTPKAIFENKSLPCKITQTTQKIGTKICSEYLLPFELLSIIMLSAILGIGYFAKEEKND